MSRNSIYVVVLVAFLLIYVLNDVSNADPIVSYKQGSNGRSEYVHAIITAKDLNTGEATSKNRKLAAYVRSLGKAGDDAGHIVANVLGGRMVTYNLFPQNLNRNRGEWKNTVELHMKKFLETYSGINDYVDFEVTLVYNKKTDTRPSRLNFVCKYYINDKLALYTLIPRVGSHRVPANPYRGLIMNP